jgi:hypothetical protein
MMGDTYASWTWYLIVFWRRWGINLDWLKLLIDHFLYFCGGSETKNASRMFLVLIVCIQVNSPVLFLDGNVSTVCRLNCHDRGRRSIRHNSDHVYQCIEQSEWNTRECGCVITKPVFHCIGRRGLSLPVEVSWPSELVYIIVQTFCWQLYCISQRLRFLVPWNDFVSRPLLYVFRLQYLISIDDSCAIPIIVSWVDMVMKIKTSSIAIIKLMKLIIPSSTAYYPEFSESILDVRQYITGFDMTRNNIADLSCHQSKYPFCSLHSTYSPPPSRYCFNCRTHSCKTVCEKSAESPPHP